MHVFPSDEAIGAYIADGIQSVIEKKPNALICIAAGTSSYPVFHALLERVKAGKLSFGKAAFIGMDEWVGLPQDADGAMADFLRRHFLNSAGFQEIFLFDGAAQPKSECERAESFLSRHGGADVIVFGIGVNGHVALNEPGVDPELRTHIANVSPVTAKIAVKYFAAGETPPLVKGVTIGLANAREAGKLFIMANTPNKRFAVLAISRSIDAGTPDASAPASYAALMPNAEFLITESVMDD